MIRLVAGFFCLLLLVFKISFPAVADQDPSALVRSILDAPTDQMSFAQAKIAVDKFSDPSIDDAAMLAELEGMVATINKMLSTLPPVEAATDMEKMKALRAFLYEAGEWNSDKPFQYDLADPLASSPARKC